MTPAWLRTTRSRGCSWSSGSAASLPRRRPCRSPSPGGGTGSTTTTATVGAAGGGRPGAGARRAPRSHASHKSQPPRQSEFIKVLSVALAASSVGGGIVSPTPKGGGLDSRSAPGPRLRIQSPVRAYTGGNRWTSLSPSRPSFLKCILRRGF